jgi:hypothetical protein
VREKLDVIVVTNPKQTPCFKHCISSIARNVPYGKLWVVAHRSHRKQVERLRIRDLIFEDEDKFIPGISFDFVKQKLLEIGITTRFGWYLQQFLQLGAALRSDFPEYYLATASDVVYLEPQDLVDSQGRARIVVQHGQPEQFPWRDVIRKLKLPAADDVGFIAEHMVFRKSIVLELFRHIERISGKPWVEQILQAVGEVRRSLPEDHPPFFSLHCFSEYETYGNFVWLHHREQYFIRDALSQVLPEVADALIGPSSSRLGYFRWADGFYGDSPNRIELEVLRRRFRLSMAGFEHFRWSTQDGFERPLWNRITRPIQFAALVLPNRLLALFRWIFGYYGDLHKFDEFRRSARRSQRAWLKNELAHTEAIAEDARAKDVAR